MAAYIWGENLHLPLMNFSIAGHQSKIALIVKNGHWNQGLPDKWQRTENQFTFIGLQLTIPIQFNLRIDYSNRREERVPLPCIGSPGKKGRLKEGSKCYVLLTVRKWPRLIPLTSNIEEASSNKRKGCKCQNAKSVGFKKRYHWIR